MNSSFSTSKLPIILYFTLTFIISWGAIIGFIGFDGFPVTTDQLTILIPTMLLGPSLSAIISTLIVSGNKSLHQLLFHFPVWKVRPFWYVVALITAPISTLIPLLILSPFSSQYLPALITTPDKITLIGMWFFSALLVGTFEELGWTGFATTHLSQKFGLLSTGLTIGLIWGFWHLLVNLEANTFSSPLAFTLLLARLFSWLPAYRILMVWLYQNTRSLFIITLMHISLVATTGILDPVLTSTPLLIFLVAKTATLYLFIYLLFSQYPQLLSPHHRKN